MPFDEPVEEGTMSSGGSATWSMVRYYHRMRGMYVYCQRVCLRPLPALGLCALAWVLGGVAPMAPGGEPAYANGANGAIAPSAEAEYVVQGGTLRLFFDDAMLDAYGWNISATGAIDDDTVPDAIALPILASSTLTLVRGFQYGRFESKNAGT